jgi:hypothetical protein
VPTATEAGAACLVAALMVLAIRLRPAAAPASVAVGTA